MPETPRKKFRLLSDKDFWRLSTQDKLAYLKTAVEVSGQFPKAGVAKKPAPKKPGP